MKQNYALTKDAMGRLSTASFFLRDAEVTASLGNGHGMATGW
jgi:hypothetical protein